MYVKTDSRSSRLPANERNLLTSLRLVFTLLAVMTALFLKFKFPRSDSPNRPADLVFSFGETRWALPLGILTFTVAVFLLLTGTLDFNQTQMDLTLGNAFVKGSRWFDNCLIECNATFS
jgi:hypothetical protein